MTKNPKESHSNSNRDSSDVKSPPTSDVARVHESNTKLWVSPLGNILDKEYPIPEPVIDGLLHLGDQCILFGKSGSGKSYITQRLCLSLAMGLDFSYYKIPKARTILYVDGEMTPSSLQKRYRKMKPKLGNPDDWVQGLRNLHYISRFIVPEFKELDLETGQHYYKQEPEIMLRTLEEQKNMQQLMNTIEIGEYEIIVLDNIFTLFTLHIIKFKPYRIQMTIAFYINTYIINKKVYMIFHILLWIAWHTKSTFSIHQFFEPIFCSITLHFALS